MDTLKDRLSKLSPEQRTALLRRMGSSAHPPVAEAEPARVRDDRLSPAQQRMWVFERMTGDASAYRIASVLRLRGALDLAALEWAVNDIVRRHEILRTVFVDTDGVPQQRVLGALHITVQCIDLHAGMQLAPEALAARIGALCAQDFDLATGPLLRVSTLQIAADEWVLVANMHHIVADGWSLRLIERELSARYAAFVAGDATVSPVPAVQYRDYVAWQRDWLQAQGARQLAYWTRKLEGAPACWPMPTRRPRAETTDLSARTRVLAIDGALASALKALAESEKASLFMVIAAALKLVLGLHAGSRDLSLGTPVANRRDPRFDASIGLFSNTVVLRTVQREGSFRAWLAEVRAAALEAFAHQDVPFEQVVDALRPERSSAHPPLFQVLFALQSTEESELHLPGLVIAPMQVERPASEFDLILEAFFRADGGEVALTWRTALFEDATIRRIEQDLVSTLDAAAAVPDHPIAALLARLGATLPADASASGEAAAALLRQHCALGRGQRVLCTDDMPECTLRAFEDWAAGSAAEYARVAADDVIDAMRTHHPHVLAAGVRAFARVRDAVGETADWPGLATVLVHGDAPAEAIALPSSLEVWQLWSGLGRPGPCLLRRVGDAHCHHRDATACLDPLGRQLPFDASGEIACASGDSGAWVRSGLRGRLLAEGALRIEGVVDHQVAIHGGRHAWIAGRRLDLGRVERILRTLPGIVDAAVLPRRDRRGVWRAVACIASGQPIAPSALLASLQEADLAVDDRPDAWIAVSRLPRGRDGRLDAEALSGLPAFSIPTGTAGQLAADPTAHASRIVWQSPEPARPWRIDRPVPKHSPQHEDAKGEGRPALIAGPALAPLPGAASLPAMLRHAAEAHAAQTLVYLQDEDQPATQQTYRELLEDSTRLMAGLRASGIGPGQRVLLQLADNRQFITAFWACALCGALPILVGLPATASVDDKDLAKIVNAWPALDIACVLGSRAHPEHAAAMTAALGGADIGLLHFETLMDAGRGASPPPLHAPVPDDVAVLFLTSGSTGIPKAVMQSHAALVSYAVAGVQRFGFDADDVSFNWMPIDHVGGLVMHHLQYVHVGARQVHCATRAILERPLRWIDELSRYRATTTWAPNFAYALVNDLLAEASSQARDWNLEALACVFNGGESVVPRTARAFVRLLAPHGLRESAMKPVWGMSETSSGTIFNERFDPHCDDATAFVSVGTPIPGMSIRIADGADQVLPEGRNGRLQVSGPTVTSGYFNNSGATSASITADGWFVTGDLAVIEDGALTITGREKDLIIVNGINYHGHEIEQVVETVDGVPEAHVAACGVRRGEDETDRLAIFYAADEAGEADPATLRARIARVVLERIGIPVAYLVPMSAEELPRTSIGKIQRPQLAQRFAQGEFDDRLGRAPSAQLELPAWFHAPGWMPCGAVDALPATDDRFVGGVLLIGGPAAWIQVIAARLRHDGLQVRCVGDAPACTVPVGDATGTPEFADLSDPHALCSVLASLDAVRGGWSVLHCAGLADPLGQDRLCGDWPDALRRGAGTLLALAQALSMLPPGLVDDVALLSRGAFAVSAEESPAVEHAAMVGLFRTIAQEQAGRHWRHLDVEPGRPTAMLLSSLIDAWRSRHALAQPTVALRHGIRYLPVLREVAAPARIDAGSGAGPDAGLDGDGLNLIVGGAGGIGALWAEWLLRHTDQSVLLLGRSAIDAPTGDDAVLARLAGHGARFRYEARDVCDPDAMRQLFDAIARRAGEGRAAPLRRVFHLAGAFHEAMVADESVAALAGACRAKVLGALTLQAQLKDLPGIELVCFGSVNGFFGGAGVAAYAAANGALEAVVLARRAAGGSARCLAWSMWDDIGMSRGYGRRAVIASRGFSVIDARRGLDSLRVALSIPQPSLTIGLDGGNPNVARHVPETLAAWWRVRASEGDVPEAIEDDFGIPHVRERAASAACTAGDADADTDPRATVLAAIWRDVLRVPEVRGSDNFFALGGDSIMAIQVVARAAKAGISLTSRALLEAQTLNDLAAAALGDAPVQGEQGLLAGEVPLGPAQAWFVDLGLDQPHHMNQSVLLRARIRLDADRLARALSRVVARHDLLRACLSWTAGAPVQRLSASVDVQVVEHRVGEDAREGAELAAAIRAVGDRVQAAIDLADGPLFAAHMLRGDAVDEDRLLLVAHHLVVDGVSWRLIVDALEQGYADPDAGDDVLPKTSSYRQWVGAITGMARGDAGQAQLAHWLALGDAPTRMPVAEDEPGGSDRRRDECSLEIALDVDATRHLVQRLPALTGIGVEELLLAAFQRAHARCSGALDLYLTLEGHGRGLALPGIDISRTVGWFTSVYPVRLHVDPGIPLIEAANAVRDQLAAVPERGALYLAMRHCGDAAMRQRLAGQPWPAISFNYLGRFDQAPEGLLSFAGESPGAQTAPDQQRIHAIDVIGAVHEQRLRFSMIYSGARYRAQTIGRFADAFADALHEFAADAVAMARQALVVPDALAAPLRALGRGEPGEWIERLLPATPMQTGLIYDSEVSGVEGAYVSHLVNELVGDLDHEALRRAWQAVVDRHDIYRSAFVADEDGRYHAAVAARAEVEWIALDWRASDARTQDARFDALVVDDGRRGFDTATPPLIRIHLVRMADDRHRMLISEHHAVSDGWSRGIVLAELAQCYRAIASGRAPALAPAPSFATYVEWLSRFDRTRARAYWSDYLDGMPAPLPYADQRNPGGTQAAVARWHGHVDADTGAAVSAFARAQRTTVSAVAQTAWALVMCAHTGSEEIAFLTTHSGRPGQLPEVERIVGPFIQTVPVRVAPYRYADAADCARALQRKDASLDEHGHLPLPEICASAGRQDLTGSFHTYFVYENFPLTVPEDEGEGLCVAWVKSLDRSDNPLMVMVVPGERLEVIAYHREDLLPHAYIEDLFADFALALRHVSGPDGAALEMAAWLPAHRMAAIEAARVAARSASHATTDALRHATAKAVDDIATTTYEF